MSPRDSIDGVVEHVAEWISLNVHGVVWIRYVSDASRDICIEKLSKYLVRPALTFAPSDPNDAAIWLEAQLSAIPKADPLPVICLKFPISLGGSEPDLIDSFSALNLRRENLLQRPLIQLWWIADRLSPLVENAAPDLSSWFKIRLTLKEPPTESLLEANPWNEQSFFNRLQLAAADRRQSDLAEQTLEVERLRQVSGLELTEDLAKALGRLSLRLSANGRHTEALAANAEELQLWHELVGRNREAFLPDLAGSLNNLATIQSEVGEREEALATAEEGVKLYGELARQNPEAFLPNLAMSLNNLAVAQIAVGKREEALATAEEAVKLRRDLAGRNREAFLPDLAMSLGALSQVHAGRGEHDLEQAKLFEALTLLVPFFEQHSQAFGQLTLQLAKDYQQACQRSSQAPDEALLARIAAILPPKKERPPAPADGPSPNQKT